MGRYYPDHPTPQQVERIHGKLARQWACIARQLECEASGQPWSPLEAWEPDRLPEAILAILEGPLAWRRIPPLSAFDPGPDYAVYLRPWTNRTDGLYWTLSPEGAQRLGVRPVRLTSRRRAAAASQGETDALGDVLSGEMVLIDGRWTPMVRLGEMVPLFRWTRDTEGWTWRTVNQVIDGEVMASLDAIGPDNLPSEFSTDEKERLFTRPAVRQTDRVGEALRQAAG
jgi:hypothetical protein